jgi:hypothetical protein
LIFHVVRSVLFSPDDDGNVLDRAVPVLLERGLEGDPFLKNDAEG